MKGGASSDARTRDRRRDRTAGAILDAARTIVVEEGADRLSLREVARRVDYSPAALYRYFPNRDALVAALGTEAITVLGACMAAVPGTLRGAERLVALCDAYAAFGDEHPHQFVLMDRLHLPPTDWAHYVSVAWPFSMLVSAVHDAMAADAIAPGDAPATALGLWALAHGFSALRAGHLRDVEAPFAEMRHAAFAAHVESLKGGASR